MENFKFLEEEYDEYFLKTKLLTDVIEKRLELLVDVLRKITIDWIKGEVAVNISNYTNKLEMAIGQTKVTLEDVKKETKDMFIVKVNEDDKLEL